MKNVVDKIKIEIDNQHDESRDYPVQIMVGRDVHSEIISFSRRHVSVPYESNTLMGYNYRYEEGLEGNQIRLLYDSDFFTYKNGLTRHVEIYKDAFIEV